MKVLMLGWELPPHNSGGLGVASYQLCKALASQGVEIEFVLPYKSENSFDFMNIISAIPQATADVWGTGFAYQSFKYIEANGEETWVNVFDQQQMYEVAVDQIAQTTFFDIIHAHDWLTFRAGMRAKERSGKPLILHVHSIESDRCGGNYGNPLVREIEQSAMLLADKVIAVSQHTKNSIIRDYGIPENYIEVVHNSIDNEDAEPLDGYTAYHYLEVMKATGHKVVVNIGRLTIQKGLPNLLRAAKEVVLHNPKTIFLIVGSGDQERELIQLAAELGISRNVIFTGFQRGKRWRDAFAIGDLFVMPSISEPFGLTPLEAIGYGTPALISKQSGVSEVLKNCLKVDFWDIKEMANQITAVLQNDGLHDTLLANAMTEQGQMSWKHSASKLLNIYDRQLELAT